jgi:Xaa-Pro dipeptidase
MLKISKALAFTVEEYRDRLDRIRKGMVKKGLDALALSTPENICYVTGFHTSGYYYPQIVVVTPDQDPIIVIRAFEAKNVDAHSWLDTSRRTTFGDSDRPMEVVASKLGELGLERKRVGIEMSGWFLSLNNFRDLEKLLPNARFVDGSGIVEFERSVKSPAEIAYIRKSCRVSEQGIQAAADNCRAGISENALAGHIHKAMVENGGEYTGLPLFIGSGHRALIPHVNWSEKIIETGEAVLVELTGVTKRYAGPLFRTLVVGKPSPKMTGYAEIVDEMVDTVVGAIRPGVTSHAVNEAATAAAREAGRGITKRAGYSIGLNFPPDWGEGLFLDLKKDDPTVLRPGMTFHIPQSMRIEGEAPIATSETVLVTDTGCEVLTHFRRGLIQV